MMVEEISRRYRLLLKTHVPFIENTRLSLLAQGYDDKEKADVRLPSGPDGCGTATGLSGWRVAVDSGAGRIPASQVVGKMMTQVSAEFQLELEQALLQEAVFVAIDLYSGRFRVQAPHQAIQGQDIKYGATP
ncbi:MAG: hypothetical protein U5K27_00250 [Desulfotignum sp.]|nr:hypothetical protein [Desulfotignum sp.]